MNLSHELLRFLNAKQRQEPPDEPPISNNDASNSNDGDASNNNRVERQEHDRELTELAEEASGCTRCALSENRNKVVFGEGSAGAEVMIIGEGPGAQEDEQGLPFVGRAGKLLRKGLRKVGLNEDRVYITNTVKCRPPDNRGPKQEELEACRPYLDKQISLIDPEVIISLGNFALQYCLGDDKRISNCRGRIYEWNDHTLVPAYHPAYILRNQNKAQEFIDDLRLAIEQLETSP